MSTVSQERVLSVHHWNDSLFSFKTTRNGGLRFRNGHFVMIGLEVEGRPLLRAFSFANANYDDHLEFYSIKVPDGPLTSRLQHIRPGDPILVGSKPTGTLILDHLLPGKRLYLLGSGTGLAPFMSLVRDPEAYERFETVVLAHGVRHVSDLGYRGYIEDELPDARARRRRGQGEAPLLPDRHARGVSESGPPHRPPRQRQAAGRPRDCRRWTPPTIA